MDKGLLRDGPLEKWWGGDPFPTCTIIFFFTNPLGLEFYFLNLILEIIFQDIKIVSGHKKGVKKIFRTNISLVKVQNTFSMTNSS